MSKNIAVIGAGVGGLASACRLASKGYKVEVFEKLSRPGGRASLLEDRGFKFDMGPSFVLMPDFFKEVFSYCRESLEDYLNFKMLDVHYKIFYPDGSSLSVYSDIRRTKEELEKFERGASLVFDKFIGETARIYREIEPLLYKSFTPKSILNPSYWSLLGKIRLMNSYWDLARRFFKNEKLCYAFTFESMFIGVSPFEAPAFYSIISYADHVQKIFHPMGGMYQIPLALEKMAKKFGTVFNYNSEVETIMPQKDKISLKIGEKSLDFDSVIVNADYTYAQSDLLRRRIPDYKYSCSVYLLYLGLKRKTRGFAHHNLFFSSDLRKNLEEIFEGGRVPEDPSFYIHVPTVTNPSLAPEGKDIFYILIPVPNLKKFNRDFSGFEENIRKVVFGKINKVLGEKIEDLIEIEHKFVPEDFIRRYNIKYGATFGLAHNLMQSAFFRPSNFDKKSKGLYFAGASTQPGGGLPVVIAGSRIVTDLITKESSLKNRPA